jgi:NAD(P)-dependent dehydrogenase (short-subunit alcohol dehydrogenase family)
MSFLDDLFGVPGKTALVTGAATGIGRMMAEALVRAGARVLIASRKGEACEAVAKELNGLGGQGSMRGSAEGFAGDVSTAEGCAALAETVKARTDKLHILVNNAGKSWGAPYHEFPFDAWDKVMSVNVAGLFTVTRDMTHLLKAAASPEDPARVVNIGSVAGETPTGDLVYSYSASKAAVHHLTRILAKELAPHQITVNALAPGPFVSNMTKHFMRSEETRSQIAHDCPMGRIGVPSDIQGCVLFLCGKSGAYVTGGVIPVSGGINVNHGHELFGGVT